MIFKLHINIKAVLGYVGLLMHVPALMALFSIPICFFFSEFYAIAPLFVTFFLSVLIGQILRVLFLKEGAFHLRDGMVTAALAWVFCPLLGAIPMYWIATKLLLLGNDSSAIAALSKPINAIFEAYSGFTTAGFSMVAKPSELPHSIQWWRSLMEWFGSLGFMVFMMSLIEPRSKEYQLYYSEVYEKKFAKNLFETSSAIYVIYLIYTVVCILLFFAAGMPLWAAINHGMCGISTGGFSITDDSFASYSTTIKVVAMFVMILGATSFVVHYKVVYKRKVRELWRNLQNRMFYLLLAFGSIFVYFTNIINLSWVDATFLWFSCLGTCGYHSIAISKLSAMIKLLLMIAMFIGGCSGSTSGGLKIRRVVHIWQGIRIRLATIMRTKAEHTEFVSHKIELPEQNKTTQILFEATILFALWIVTLFTSFFLLNILNRNTSSLDLLFDVASALSNVGLSTDFIGEGLGTISKIVVMVTILLGRLEIIPFLILFLNWFFSTTNRQTKIEPY